MADLWREESDLQAFYDAMRPVQVSEHGPYSREDRYRDFREVFFGSEAGRRVLSQINTLCTFHEPGPGELESHAMLAWQAGRRSVFRNIVYWMAAVPPDPVIETQEDE